MRRAIMLISSINESGRTYSGHLHFRLMSANRGINRPEAGGLLDVWRYSRESDSTRSHRNAHVRTCWRAVLK